MEIKKCKAERSFKFVGGGTLLCIERNHLARCSVQPPLQNFGPHCGARGKGSTIDPINRDLCALPSPLRPLGGRRRRRRRRRGGRGARANDELLRNSRISQTMRRRCRVRVVVGSRSPFPSCSLSPLDSPPPLA